MEKKIYEMPECEMIMLEGEVITSSTGLDLTAGHTEEEMWVGPTV